MDRRRETADLLRLRHMPVGSPAEAVAMIDNGVRRTGRAGADQLRGVWDLSRDARPRRTREGCRRGEPRRRLSRVRALVHHGGAGTTAAGVRAGMPTLMLWVGAEQPVWAVQIKKLKLGSHGAFRAPPGNRWSRGSAHPRARVRRSSPRNRHPDDQTRRQRYGRSRPAGRRRRVSPSFPSVSQMITGCGPTPRIEPK